MSSGPSHLKIALSWDGQPIPESEQVLLTLSRDSDALILDVDAPFYDDPAPASPPGSTWALWEHEVVELFILGRDGAYTEIELGPHGHYLALKLSSVRQIAERELLLTFMPQRSIDRWRGQVRLPLDLLPANPVAINGNAIHGQGAQRRYLSAALLGGPAPDFHQPARWLPFSLHLP